MKSKLPATLVICIVFFISVSTFVGSGAETTTINAPLNDGWYYLPAYPNYAPSGLPDFDQRAQKDWRSRLIIWSLCAPTSLANIFWWFDSKHADPHGIPGDGNDTYPMVQDFLPPGTPEPGPYTDDHGFNNVNDAETPLAKWTAQGELIEQIAWYVNHNFRRFPPLSFLIAGTRQYMMKWGVEQWIKDAGLQDKYFVEHYFTPDFQLLANKLQNNSGIVLLLRFYNPLSRMFPLPNDHYWKTVFSGHYVALAGVHPDGYIALSDPYLNIVNPDPCPTEHNDARIVSHDVYEVDFSSPDSRHASFWIPEYWFSGVLVTYALVISEIDA
jgi:hypothetical protein